jgi:hypothetical protein
MNGWWWDPAAPGRGFFFEYANAAWRFAHCGYGGDGKPQWQAAGPLIGKSESELAEEDFHLVFKGRDRARLEWRGERIDLVHQHTGLRNAALTWDAPLSGWFVEEGTTAPRTFICEQLGRRIFAALLAQGEWLLFEAKRGRHGDFPGPWRRYAGGQVAGGAHRAPAGQVIDEGGNVALEADGALRIRLPGGSTARFGRPGVTRAQAAERLSRARPLEVIFSAPEGGRGVSGLVALSLEADGGPAMAETNYRLVIESSDARAPRFERDVRIDGWTRKLALLVNTHLLPNGYVPLTARLQTNGADAWREDFGLTVANTGPLAGTVRESLRSRNAPLVIMDAVDSTDFDIENPALRPWFDRPDAMKHIAALREAGKIDAREEAALRQFVEEGYLVMDDAIEEPLLRRINGELDEAIREGVQGYSYGSSQRIRNLHQRYGGVKALWRHPGVMRLLELVFDVPARPCQTLTYVFGSQQEAHQDTVHLTPFPQGYMCGVWVALEDVKPDSGELEVFPGTHRLPHVYMHGSGCEKVTDDDWADFGEKIVKRYRRMLDEGGFRSVTYRPKRGTVLVWHENLLHGGSVRRDTSLSRRSIVSHYFADGAIAFYDSTGLPGHME